MFQKFNVISILKIESKKHAFTTTYDSNSSETSMTSMIQEKRIELFFFYHTNLCIPTVNLSSEKATKEIKPNWIIPLRLSASIAQSESLSALK